MPIPIIPASVPCPLASDYQSQAKETLQTAQMQNGRVRVRERWRNTPSEIQLKFIMTEEQFNAFEGFLKWECNNGAKPFKMNLRMPRSKELEPYTVRLTSTFNGPTLVDPSQGLWAVSYTALTTKSVTSTFNEYAEQVIGIPVEEANSLLAAGINTYWLKEEY